MEGSRIIVNAGGAGVAVGKNAHGDVDRQREDVHGVHAARDENTPKEETLARNTVPA